MGAIKSFNRGLLISASVNGIRANIIASDAMFLKQANSDKLLLVGFCAMLHENDVSLVKSLCNGGGALVCFTARTDDQDAGFQGKEGIRTGVSFNAEIISNQLSLIPAYTQHSEKFFKASHYWFVDKNIFESMISVTDIEEENMFTMNYVERNQGIDHLSDEMKTKLREDIKKIILRDSPYPMKDEWIGHFVDLVAIPQFLKPIIRGVDSNQLFWYFNLPIRDGLPYIGIAHGMAEFQKIFKRIPQIKTICAMINPKKFNPKTWTNFLAEISHTKDSFLELDLESQLNFVYTYEAFGERYKEIQKLCLPYFRFTSINTKGVAVALANGNFNLDLIVKGIRELIKYLKEKENEDDSFLESVKTAAVLRAFLSSCDQFADRLGELVNKPSELANAIEEIFYTCKPGAEELRAAAIRRLITQAEFDDYQELYLAAAPRFMKAGRQLPAFHETLKSNPKYAFEFIDAGVPDSYFVGLDTDCCQHLHSAGKSCVEFMAHHPEISGIFRVIKNGKTVAQSFVWFHEQAGVVCCDNIEILGGEMRDEIWKAYCEYARILYRYAPMFGYNKVTVGLGCNDLRGLSNLPHEKKPALLAQVPGGESTYSDARSQVILADFSKTPGRFFGEDD
ncbi:hypothetical protein ACHJH3_06445 [Campylobacter sp. MOP7]|uniref:hypothetical protein n=1 Tax=Campylobacter canis TaxID=3378588 RepID=UPI00387E8793